MTALLAIKKCGCARERCWLCGRVVGKLVWSRRCLRHGDPLAITQAFTITFCGKCANKPRGGTP